MFLYVCNSLPLYAKLCYFAIFILIFIFQHKTGKICLKELITLKREQLDKLSIEEQLEAFNKIIKEQGSLSKAIKVTGMPKSTIKSRLDKIGYKYSEEAKQFVKDTNTQLEGQISLIEPTEANKQDNNPVETKESSNLVDITELEQIVNRIIDERLSSLNKTEKSSIELSSKCDGDVKYRSYGVYKSVSDEFDQYAEKHNLYSKVQLVSQSLIEFMERHK